jgi:cytochrome c oxidase subunit 1
MSAVSVPLQRQPLWRQLIGFNVFTGIVGAVIGYLIGQLIGDAIHAKSLTYYTTEAGQNDVAILLGYFFGVVGFLAGLGFLNYPLRRMLGHPPTLAEHESEGEGWIRYIRLCTDHKVVGLQYLIGIGVFFLVGGINAMLIRTELLQPNVHVFGANQYLTLVGMHGAMMMGMMTSGVLGPFANWVVPLMIGTRRMAFPRIEAFTFWLLMAAGVVLVTTIFFGGFQTGWTGYAPLSDQGTAGFDAYIGFFALVGTSMTLLGFNLIATIITMRAPGMTWSRLPIFVWSVLATSALMMLAAPMLIATLLMQAMDRTAQTAFFIAGNGGSAYLYQNLFWVFGHPEVYIVALPGFGIVLELLPVFTRKPLWGYRIAVAGMLGVGLLSFFVWQHHLFVSGMNADLRPFFMLSTELISLPTGFIFLSAMGTLWQGRIRLTVPMLFCLGWAFNFLWGGISGVFLSDAPSDVDTHGTFFSMAHFHYTIMGGLVFTVFAAIYYWGPKMTGFKFNERLARIHFWSLFVAFNCTFAPLFALGFMGMPRRVVTYPANLQGLNDWVSVWAFIIGLSMVVFLVNLVWSLVFKREVSEANPWGAKSAEFALPTPVPLHNFDRFPVFDADPYPYGVERPEVPGAVATAGD